MNKIPELPQIQQLANQLYILLNQTDKPLTKAEIAQNLGFEFNTNNERRVRAIISLLAQKRPIIATSDKKGYRLAKSKEDLNDIEHQWKEFDSRIEELEKRKVPLMKFYEKVKENI